jgi:ABC-type lipoprotein release transport system permease subunit
VTDQSQAPNLTAIKDRQQKTWTSGNYARIGNTLVIMGELLCEAVNVHAGDKVLDVATGSGNTAILRCPQVLRGNRHRLRPGTNRTRPRAR